MGNVCTALESQAPYRQATLGAGKFIWDMCVLHQKARHHVDRLHLGQVSLYGKCVINLPAPSVACLHDAWPSDAVHTFPI
jgi:hypothetical protein